MNKARKAQIFIFWFQYPKCTTEHINFKKKVSFWCFFKLFYFTTKFTYFCVIIKFLLHFWSTMHLPVQIFSKCLKNFIRKIWCQLKLWCKNCLFEKLFHLMVRTKRIDMNIPLLRTLLPKLGRMLLLSFLGKTRLQLIEHLSHWLFWFWLSIISALSITFNQLSTSLITTQLTV